ncbi:hypothetical protein RI129_010388 [Pyrocoelia pectoralis]|uniref:Putative inorganic phosphate cotransporter n=1 Tax=Pyrocoelia pectoralis TaxID=417401 RepID=A0AAN7ZJU5_9COLE
MVVAQHEESSKIVDNLHPDVWYGARHTQTLMLFVLLTIAYGMRVNLSVGIVAMTDPTASPSPDIPTYVWEDESVILSSFFWGYVIPQIGAGQLAKYYGPKWFLVGSMTLGSLFTILIPIMAALGSWAVILCRIIQGLTQGFICPSCHYLMSQWVPPRERARLGTFIYAGGPFGTVVSLTFTGWISETKVGWPYAFYIYGAAGLLWVLLWIFLGRNSPTDHTTIDPQEKAYIEASLGHTEEKEISPTPWGSIVRSLPFWAILLAQCGQNWGFTTLLTNIPTFLKNVLNFDIKSNGLLSAGPYLLFWILSFVFSTITDYSITKGILTTGTARKVANSIGTLVPAASLTILGIISDLDYDITDAAIVLLFIAVGVNSCTFCGFNVNHMDISPNHAGTLMGITNGLSNITSIIAPLIMQYIVTVPSSTIQWSIIFYISAIIYVVGNTFFILFGSGERQVWDNSVEEDEKVTDVKVEDARY